MLTRIRSFVENRVLNHSFRPCRTPLSVREPSCFNTGLGDGGGGGGGGGGPATIVVTVAELSPVFVSAGVDVRGAVAVSVPLAVTLVITVTCATRFPDRKSRSQLSAVVPVQPGPRVDEDETKLTCAGRLIVAFRSLATPDLIAAAIV